MYSEKLFTHIFWLGYKYLQISYAGPARETRDCSSRFLGIFSKNKNPIRSTLCVCASRSLHYDFTTTLWGWASLKLNAVRHWSWALLRLNVTFQNSGKIWNLRVKLSKCKNPKKRNPKKIRKKALRCISSQHWPLFSIFIYLDPS